MIWTRRVTTAGLGGALFLSFMGSAIAQNVSAATPEQEARWHREMEAAREKRSSGYKVMAGGLLSYAVGEIAILKCVRDFGCGPGPVILGAGGVYAGIPISIVGQARARDAKLEIKWLAEHGPAPMAPETWQRERETADRHKSLGRKAMFAGIGVAVAGIAITHDTRSRAGFFTFMGGTIVGLGGLNAVRDGGLAIRLLKAHPPAGTLGAYPVSHVERSIAFNPGSATSIAYRVTW